MEVRTNSPRERLLEEVLTFIKTDFWPGLSGVDRWRAISFRSLRSMNRRSKLGFLWVIMSATIFVVAVSLVYSLVFNTDINVLLPYIAAGYITWGLISSQLMSMPVLFTTYSGYITQKNLPFTLYVAANAFEKIVVFFAQSVVILVTCWIFDIGFSFALLILPVSIVLIFLTSIGTSLIVGVVAIRYRDLSQIVNSSILIIFLLTPILWKPEFAGNRMLIVDLNPFYHFIHIVRAPIIDHLIPWASLLVTAGISLVSFVVGFIVMAVYRHRIIYWI